MYKKKASTNYVADKCYFGLCSGDGYIQIKPIGGSEENYAFGKFCRCVDDHMFSVLMKTNELTEWQIGESGERRLN